MSTHGCSPVSGIHANEPALVNGHCASVYSRFAGPGGMQAGSASVTAAASAGQLVGALRDGDPPHE
jgi:hypothetical protein